MYTESCLIYCNKHSFYEYHDIIKFKSNSIEPKYDYLDNFQRKINSIF